MNANAQAFLDVYRIELAKDMEKEPVEYGIKADTLQELLEKIVGCANSTSFKMVSAMASGELVNVSNAMRRTARRLGIPQTVKAIHAYCKEEMTSHV